MHEIGSYTKLVVRPIMNPIEPIIFPTLNPKSFPLAISHYRSQHIWPFWIPNVLPSDNLA